MAFFVTPFYTGILALGLIALSLNVIGLRRKYNIPVGDGGNLELLRAMSAHSNFVENVPITMLLIGFCELMGGHWLLINILCLLLIIGRLLHAQAVSDINEAGRQRVHGMKITFASMAGAGFLAMLLSIWSVLQPLVGQ